MANWDESKHPRDNDGKFGYGGGGGDAVVKFDGDDGDALAKDLAALRANASVEQREQGDAVGRLVRQYGVGRWSKMDTQTKEREIALEVQRGRRKELYSSLEKQVGTGEALDLLRTVGLSDIDDYRDRSAIKRKAERLATLGGLKFDADSGKFLARNNMMIFYGDPIALNWAAEDGAKPAVRVQLSPFGEFVLRDGGKRSGTVQHCSRAAFEAMVANWKSMGEPDVLVDVDHASATGGSTEAAAWAKNLRVEDDGLCADFELTPKGRELVEGKCYRFVSPGWTLADDGTPVALCSVALTNRPNLPVKPVVNADFDESKHPRAEDGKFSSGGGGGGEASGGTSKSDGYADHLVKRTAAEGVSPLTGKHSPSQINKALGMLREAHTARKSGFTGVGGSDKGDAADRKSIHAAAIRMGFKYNRSTHRYE